MPDKLTAIRLKQQNGQYGPQIPIGAKAENIKYDKIYSVKEVLGNVDTIKGPLQKQIDNIDTSAISEAVTDWLEDNPGALLPTDKTLSLADVPADAEQTGKIITINDEPDGQATKVHFNTNNQVVNLATMDDIPDMTQIFDSGIIIDATANDLINGNVNYASGAITIPSNDSVMTNMISVKKFCSVYKNTNYRLKIVAYSNNTEDSYIDGISIAPNTVNKYQPYTQVDLLRDFPTAKYVIIEFKVWENGAWADPQSPANVLAIDPKLKFYILPDIVDKIENAVVVDNTLSISNEAADAKETGDAIIKLNTVFNSANNGFMFSSEKISGVGAIILSEIGYYQTAQAESVSSFIVSEDYRSAKINCSEGDSFVINTQGAGGVYRPWAFLDSNNIVLSRCSESISTDEVIIAPENAAYLIVNNRIVVKPTGYYAYKNKNVPNDTLIGLVGKDAYSPIWEKGRYDPSTGEKTTSSSHIRTTEKFAYASTLAIIVKNSRALNIRYRLTFFDSNNSHIFTTDFLTRGCMIKNIAPEGTETFAISVVKSDNVSDLAYGQAIQITNYDNTLLPPDGELQTMMYGNKQVIPMWENGGIYTASGEESISSTFVRTIEYIPYSNNLVIALTNALGKIRFRVFYYKEPNTNEGSYIGFSGDQSNNFHKRGIRISDYAPEDTVYFRIIATKADSAIAANDTGATIVITDGQYVSLPLDEQVNEIVNELKEQGIDQLPDYYEDYLRTKAKEIISKQNNMSVNSVQFFLISDYHTRTNEGHSKAMLRRLSSETGITMLCYTGDGGGKLGTSDDKMLEAIIRTSEVWDGLENSIKEFYGTLGNHEWITATYFHRSTVTNVFLGRYKNTAFDMQPYYGSYSVDNKFNKVRYYFLQCKSNAAASAYKWMAEDLLTVPAGYNVAVFMHHGAIPGAASEDEYDGVVLSDTGEVNDVARTIAEILHKFETHGTVEFTIDNIQYSYNYSSRQGYNDSVIGIFCGHYHHGTLFPKNDELNAYKIMVFRASTDSLQAASIAQNNTPWYWKDGIIGGTKIVREAETLNEQCFYAVQVDLDTKDIYITAIGGDHDWETNYANEE